MKLTITFLTLALFGCQSTTVHHHGDGPVVVTESVEYGSGEATQAIAEGVGDAVPIAAEAQAGMPVIDMPETTQIDPTEDLP